MSKTWVPLPGDLIKLDLDPKVGHEQSGWRPAIVVSEPAYNRRAGLCLVCPITNQVKGYPFEVQLGPDCEITGVVLADQIKNVDFKVRRAKPAGRAPHEVLDTVRGYIALLIGAK